MLDFIYRMQRHQLTTGDVLSLVVIMATIIGFIIGASLAAQSYFDRHMEPVEQMSYTRITPEMRIFVNECLQEGNKFGPCYTVWMRSQVWGSEPLNMPTDWC